MMDKQKRDAVFFFLRLEHVKQRKKWSGNEQPDEQNSGMVKSMQRHCA
jgi:hypothetical protein